MGKYSRHAPDKVTKKDPSQTLAWRGIGCLLILIVPTISYFAALLTLASPARDYIPPQLLDSQTFPPYLYSTPTLADIFTWLASIQDLYAIVLVTAMYTMVVGGLISWLYSVAYRMVNPKRYGPTDAPPPNVKVKKYKR